MKIVYSISGTYSAAGMERVLSDKANYLVQMGFHVVILTTDQKNRPPYFALDERIQCIDLGINYCDDQRKGLFSKILSYRTKTRMHKKKLRQILPEIKADITISMFDHDADLLWRVDDGSKKILEIHFSRFKRLQYDRKGLWKLVDRWRSKQDGRVAKRYDRFVVLTEEDRTDWGRIPNICVIPNAVSFPHNDLSTGESKQVIAVGRYNHQKNFGALIQAWQLVHGQRPDWYLRIYGDGELKAFYQQQIDQLNLQDVITLCPTTQDIQQAYQQSAILAMSSRYEGLPMALLEAQACGLPLVSFACKCGPKDIILEGKNGLLVDPGDIKGLAQALLKLMGDESLRKAMGAFSAKQAALYTKPIIMRSWINLFKGL